MAGRGRLLPIGATSAYPASRNGPVMDAYASTISLPSAEDRLFERAKGNLD